MSDSPSSLIRINRDESAPKWVDIALKATKLEIQDTARRLLLPRLHTLARIADGDEIAYAELMTARGEIVRVAREPTVGERIRAIEGLAKIAAVLTEAEDAAPDDEQTETPKEIEALAQRAVGRLEELAASLARHRRDATPMAGLGESGAGSSSP